MSITFHCEHCHREVKAPESAAGRRGKCPYCGQNSYVPDPRQQDEIPLAPVDSDEELRRQAEIQRLRQAERALLEEDQSAPISYDEPSGNINPEDLYHHVVNYCLDMSQSNLKRAQTHVEKLRPHKYTALQAVEDFVTGQALEPALEPIPPKLLRGFLDQLRQQLR